MRGKACNAITHAIERRDRLTFRRGREGRRRQAKNSAVLQKMCETRAGFSPHETSPRAVGCRDLRARDQVARHDERHARVRRLDPGPECFPGLGRLQRALRARPDRQPLGRHALFAGWSDEAGEARDHGFQRSLHIVVRESEGIDGDDEPLRQLEGQAIAEHYLADPGECRGVTCKPAGRIGRRRLGQHPIERQAAVCRANAVEAAETRRHAHGATRVGAESRIAKVARHRRCRSR